MKKSELKKLRLEERDQAFKKKALAKVINERGKSIYEQIGEINIRSEILDEDNSIFYYTSLKKFGENSKINLKSKPISYKGGVSQYKTNLKDDMNRNFIYLKSGECFLSLMEYIDIENITLHIIEGGINSGWPKAKCNHYEKTGSYLEMLQDYQPSHILFYPVHPGDMSSGHCAFGIYLLDEDHNFLCKQIVEIFDEEIAANCKNFRIPKRASELLVGD